ncbi:MAG: cytochrome P450 [Myxococcota bacterium]|nr:cytochrome P450 [Myxococcota bacterium]
MEYDINDLSIPFEERHAACRWLRDNDPVHWDEKNGFWILTRHEDVRALAKDADRFSNAIHGPWHMMSTTRGSIECMDGRAHLRTRNLVSRAFTPRIVSYLSEHAHRYIDEAIDRVLPLGACDFVEALAVPVPMRLIAEMIGIADGDIDQFRRWSDAIFEATSSDPQRSQAVAEASAALASYLGEAIGKRRAEPRDDILSSLIAARDAGALGEDAGLAHDELIQFLMLLIMAGNETTRNAISGGMLALLQHPEQLERLRQDLALMPTAVEEILRWTSVVRALCRTVTRDTELCGKQLLEGQRVLMIYTSANRDERVFDAPHEFRVDRTPNEHLTFGFGAHYCLGANLAKMEIAVVMREVVSRLPGLRLAPRAEIRRDDGALAETITSLPVVF